MTTRVTDQGLLVPKELLGDVEEFEIRQEDGKIVIVPTGTQDPIFELGRDPVVTDVDDASTNHDAYLYN